jgi:50S ribosome-binding GTPase
MPRRTRPDERDGLVTNQQLLAPRVSDFDVLYRAYVRAGLPAAAAQTETAQQPLESGDDVYRFTRAFLLAEALIRHRVGRLVHGGSGVRHLAVFGGNNVGKSTVINILAAEQVASTSLEGAHTQHPTPVRSNRVIAPPWSSIESAHQAGEASLASRARTHGGPNVLTQLFNAGTPAIHIRAMLLLHASLGDDIGKLIGELRNLRRVLLDVLERLITERLRHGYSLLAGLDLGAGAGGPGPAFLGCTLGHACSP